VLKIGLEYIRNTWLLDSKPIKLKVSIHLGNLVYSLPKSGRRISYTALKKELKKQTIIIKQPLQQLSL
jgi:hypothetical protein